MKAIRVNQYGGSDVLSLEEIPTPEPKAGEVRIKVAAAGLNFIEIYQRSGLYQGNLPFTLGAEAAGVVDAIGQGVKDVKIGTRVLTVAASGAYADYTIAPAAKCAPLPKSLGFEDAVALGIQGMTAHYLACDTFPLKKGHTCLIHAAAGGTGALLVQIARLRGATVIGTVGSEEKAKIAKRAGAHKIINYNTQDFEAEVKKLTKGAGVDVVYDSVGKDTFDKSLNCLKPRGMMVLFGQASGPVPPFNAQVLNQKGSLYLTRPSLFAYIAQREQLLKKVNDLSRWVASGALKLKVDKRFSLVEAGRAHDYMAGRGTKGKVVIVP
jgi:NADPH2:quinone reductase